MKRYIFESYLNHLIAELDAVQQQLFKLQLKPLYNLDLIFKEFVRNTQYNIRTMITSFEKLSNELEKFSQF